MPAYDISPGERNPQRIVTALRQTQQGRVNCTGMVTLATGASTTVVQAATAGVGAKVELESSSAAAAVERASGNLWVSNPVTVAGQFTINHTNSATAGRTFAWFVFG